jgi:hypothetical protein
MACPSLDNQYHSGPGAQSISKLKWAEPLFTDLLPQAPRRIEEEGMERDKEGGEWWQPPGDSIRRLAGCPTTPYHKRLGHQTGRPGVVGVEGAAYPEGPFSVQTSLGESQKTEGAFNPFPRLSFHIWSPAAFIQGQSALTTPAPGLPAPRQRESHRSSSPLTQKASRRT